MGNIKKYFFEQLTDIAEIHEIITTLQAEFDTLNSNIYKVLDSMFLLYLDEEACTRYEKMLDIKPRENDTLQDRRFKILSIYKSDTPYTITSLKNKLEELCGSGNVEIILDESNYYIEVWIGLASKNQFDTAYKIIRKMLPCNLLLKYKLKYNQHSTLANYTHEQLSDYTHDQLKNFVIGE